MTAFRIGSWALTAVMLMGMANRAEGQYMPGFGSVRYGGYVGPYGGSVSTAQGPFGGSVSVAQGPFGGGAVSVRGPFGGRVTVAGAGVAPVVALPVAPTIVPVPVVQQTVLNPAPAPLPYSAAYAALIPPGYPSLALAGTNYLYTTVLPPLAQPVAVGGVSYYVSNGIYYQPYFLGTRTVYVVAPH
jgi:hypothetical protein